MENKKTIGNVTAGLMILLALVGDGLQFLLTLSVLLLPLSVLVTFLFSTSFVLWFLILGAYSGKGAEKKALTSGVSTVAEFIPIINAVPAITAGVLINIVLSRIDDAKKTIVADPKKAMAMARLQRMQAARAARTNGLRESREQTQQDRHAPANDNNDSEMRNAA